MKKKTLFLLASTILLSGVVTTSCNENNPTVTNNYATFSVNATEGGTYAFYLNGVEVSENEIEIGSNVNLLVSPENGYRILSVVANGTQLRGRNNIYTFEVLENNNLEIKFSFIETQSSDFSYTLNETNDGLIISSYNPSSSLIPYLCEIPESASLNGNSYHVVGISSSAFTNSGVERIKLSRYITEIESDALNSIYSLSEIQVDENNEKYSSLAGILLSKDGSTIVSVPPLHDGEIDFSRITKIGEYAFSNNRYLGDLVINENITEIGDYAFSTTRGLNSVTFPNTEITLGDGLFYQSVDLTRVTLSNKLVRIPDDTFNGCIALNRVILPDSVKEIGVLAFNNCASMYDFTPSNSLEVIESGAFGDCTALSSFTCPTSLKSIGSAAFDNCTSLTDVTLNEGLLEIGVYAFNFCTYLREVKIPSTVTTIEGNPFVATGDRFRAISLDEKNEHFSVVDGVLYNKDQTRLICYLYGKNDVSSFTVPSTVKIIDKYAFAYQSYLSSITLPRSIETIRVSFYNLLRSPSLNYEGTCAEFGYIDKDAGWYQNSAFSGNVCTCSDGTVNLPALNGSN